MGNCGAPGEIRTPNPQVRSLVLYPVELRAQAQKEAPVTGAKMEKVLSLPGLLIGEPYNNLRINS